MVVKRIGEDNQNDNQNVDDYGGKLAVERKKEQSFQNSKGGEIRSNNFKNHQRLNECLWGRNSTLISENSMHQKEIQREWMKNNGNNLKCAAPVPDDQLVPPSPFRDRPEAPGWALDEAAGLGHLCDPPPVPGHMDTLSGPLGGMSNGHLFTQAMG